jgi:hypothetical protein
MAARDIRAVFPSNRAADTMPVAGSSVDQVPRLCRTTYPGMGAQSFFLEMECQQRLLGDHEGLRDTDASRGPDDMSVLPSPVAAMRPELVRRDDAGSTAGYGMSQRPDTTPCPRRITRSDFVYRGHHRALRCSAVCAITNPLWAVSLILSRKDVSLSPRPHQEKRHQTLSRSSSATLRRTIVRTATGRPARPPTTTCFKRRDPASGRIGRPESRPARPAPNTRHGAMAECTMATWVLIVWISFGATWR